MMSDKLFETALDIAEPWHVASVDLDATAKTLTISIDFSGGSRFTVPGESGVHPVHDTVSKRYWRLNFFQHECYLQVRVPRVKLPNGAVLQVEPNWIGKLSGFTRLPEALGLLLAREMPFAAVARLVGLRRAWHRVAAICDRYVDLALA
jgi:transposase